MSRADKPTFSILLPTHNRADVLPFAVESVLAQTREDFELLIVGDGCTDDTSAVVESFQDSRIHWFDLPKAPHFGYANRNRVLKKAKGDLVGFAAHDDLWFPDHLEMLAGYFDDPSIDIVISRPLWCSPTGSLAPSTFNLHASRVMSRFSAKAQNEIPASAVLHRRSCFEDVGYWDEDLAGGGDWDLWLRMLGNSDRGGHFAFHPHPTVVHFRANWRAEDPPFVRSWEHRLRSSSDGFARDLQVGMTEGQTEQEAVWKEIQSDPGGWSTRTRTAAVVAIDTLARNWEGVESMITRQATPMSAWSDRSATPTYKLQVVNDHKVVWSESEEVVATVDDGSLIGFVDACELIGELLLIRGWAGEGDGIRSVESLVFFKGDTAVGFTVPTVLRTDVSTSLGRPEMTHSGFEAWISWAGSLTDRLSVVAFLDDMASELRFSVNVTPPWVRS